MTRRFSRQGTLGLMLLAPVLAAAAQPVPDTEDATASVEARGFGAAGRVSLPLHEFLGEFMTEDGEWVDPAILIEGDIVATVQTGMGREGQETRGSADDDATRNENCVEPRCEK